MGWWDTGSQAGPRGFQSRPEASTPLKRYLQIGLGGSAFLPPSTGAFGGGRRSPRLSTA